jgi:hypothetical protein
VMAAIQPDGVYVACSWCHQVARLDGPKTYCRNCGHRADVARADCDCDACVGLRELAAADPRRV